MLEIFSTADAWIGLLTLILLEIILGIDNIVFIAILTDRLPKHEQKRAYRLGLFGAMFTRIGLLFAISWVMHLNTELFAVLDHPFNGRDLIMLGGGLFLIGKAVQEIYEKVEGDDDEHVEGWFKGLAGVVVQIMVMDIIFSLDSVVTAVGMVEHVEVMIAAVVVSVGVMLLFAKPVGDFVNTHPSMKILALAFLMLIGLVLVADGFGEPMEKGYIYFAMGFGLTIELLNMRFRKHEKDRAIPIDLSDED